MPRYIPVELTDEVLFINRPLPPGNRDLIEYIEEQIAGLLFAGESIDDVLFRFSISGDKLLIALARTALLEKKPLPTAVTCFRIPAAVGLWQDITEFLPSDAPALIYAKHADRAYLISADAKRLLQVFQFRETPEMERAMVPVVEKLQDSCGGKPMTLYSRENLPGLLGAMLRERGIVHVQKPLPASRKPYDSGVLEQWDFRLDAEVRAQESSRQRYRVVRSALVTAACIAVFWLSLFFADMLLNRLERSSAAKWESLQGALKEITYCSRQTQQYIAEIMLCRRLSEKRTGRAVVLQRLAVTRPDPVRLDELHISERKKQFRKSAGITAEEFVVIRGHSQAPKAITGWMEVLGPAFSSVKLVSMEKNGPEYQFTIECGLAGKP
ncbi:MAG: hypothetical protein MUF22_02830 [Chitinispirillaceae bacterium]|jgi:hypothetical protein|nr:hypothetical protein [Chitinispirillaceae bacterium]